MPVDEQRAEGGEGPEHDDEVEQGGPGVDEVVSLEGEHDGGDGAEQAGLE